MVPEANGVATSLLLLYAIVESTIPGLRWARLPIVAEGPLAQWCYLKLLALSLVNIGHGSLDLVNKLQQVYGEGFWDVQIELPATEHLNGLVLCVHIYRVFEEGTVVKPPSTSYILQKHAWSCSSPTRSRSPPLVCPSQWCVGGLSC